MGNATDAILLKLGLDASGFTKGTRDARKELGLLGEATDGLKGQLAGLAATAAAGIGIAALTHEAMEFAEAVTRVHDQTGLSVESIQYLRLAADQTGGSVDSLASLVQKMQRQLVEASNGNEKVAEGFERLGLSVTSLRALAPEDQLQAIAAAIAQIPDPAERSAAAVDAFGKAGGEAVPQLMAMVEQQQAINEAFARTGGAVSEDAIAKVEGLGDAVGETKTALVAMATELLSAAAPALTSFFQTVTEIVGGLRLLSGSGDDTFVNLDNQINEAQSLLDHMRATNPYPDKFIADAIAKQEALVKSLTDEYNARQKLGTAGVESMRQELALKQSLTAATDDATTRLVAGLEDEAAAREFFGGVVFEGEVTRQQQFEEFRDAAAARYFKRLEDESKREVAIRKMTQDEITGVLEETTAAQADLQKIFWGDQITTALGALEQMTEGVARHSRAMFEINKAASIANAIVNTSQGVTKALAEYPPPLSFVMAAAQAAAGAAQIQAIASTRFGSKTAPSQAAQPVTPTAPVGGSAGGQSTQGGSVMRVEGIQPDSLLTGRMVRSIAERLNEFGRDGGRVEFA